MSVLSPLALRCLVLLVTPVKYFVDLSSYALS